jgi:multiple sugar transport system substrate-binding protein
MFDKAGVAYPPADAAHAWTWDQFVANAKLLTLDKNGNNATSPKFDPKNIVQYGCMVENLTWQLEVWCLSNGSGFYNKDGTKVTINDPAAVEAIQKVADLYLVDHVAPLSAGLTDDAMQRSIIAGTCAMGTGGAWNVGTCLASARKEGLDYGVAVLPYMKQKVTICTGGPNVVFAQSKHKAEAMEWIKWYAKEENSWSLIESGIWMPVLQKWYTDETFTHKWVDNPNFPPYAQYKSAVVDYAMNNSKSTSWYYVNNTIDFNTLLGSLLGEVWTGNKTAKDAITGGYSALVDAYKGAE